MAASAWAQAPSGTVVAWGDNTGGPLNVPAGLSGVIALAAGGGFGGSDGAHVLALKNDNTVVAWGDNSFGQASVPPGLSKVIAVVAGYYCSVALKADGTLVAWGVDAKMLAGAPADLGRVSAITLSGGVHNGGALLGPGTTAFVALKNNGTLTAWGYSDDGQTDVPPGLSGVTAISSSGHVMALTSDGTVVAWGGQNAQGQTNVPAGLRDVVAIAAVGGHSLALKRDGTVAAWGNNNFGQTDVPAGLKDVVAISGGGQHSLALKSDGTIVAWGQNREGQIAVPVGLGGVTAIVGGPRFSAAVIGAAGIAPTITVQPTTLSVAANAATVLNVTAAGTELLRYQWRKDGVNVAGATNASLTLNSPQAGTYTVTVTNAYGSVTSNPATLTVSTNTTDPGRLINLSILTPLATGESMTIGTVLGGAGTSGSKPLLARAVGPSLAPLGVNAFLPDPTMSLVNTSASPSVTVATNNDWAGTTALANAFAAVGAFAYTNAASKDAAIFQPALVAGNYTMQVNDAGNGTGTVIAELYDASGTNYTLATPRLVNVSVLKQISTGASLTAGFVVGGATARTVLVRAVGPTLGVAPFGLGGTMPDPQLKLFNSAQAVIASNDDWGGDAQIANAASRVGAFALSAASSKDAVLLQTLAPGNYTAQVSPASGTTGGTAIVEVYEVP